MNTNLTTTTKVRTVFICDGVTKHVHSGLELLRAGCGYVCPSCGADVSDCTQTPVGRFYFDIVRPDLTHPRKAQ